MRHGRLVPLLGAAMVAAAGGCGEDVRSAAAAGDGGSGRATAAPMAVRTASVPANPCDWISVDQVAALLGPLDGEAERIRSVEQPEPSDDGRACLYRLAAQPRLGGRGVLVEVSPAAGVLVERVGGAMQEHFAAALRHSGAGA